MKGTRKLGLAKLAHLEESSLLSFLDGELAAADHKLAEEHIASCWTCRDRQARMQENIREFLTFRETLIPCDLIPEQAPVEQFRQRLSRHVQAQQDRRTPWSVAWDGFRGAISAMAAHRQAALAMVVVTGVLFATFTDVLTSTASAATLLRRAESFESAHPVDAGSVGLQSVRVEHVNSAHQTQDLGTLEFAKDGTGAMYMTGPTSAAPRKSGLLIPAASEIVSLNMLPPENSLPTSVENYIEAEHWLPDVSVSEFKKLVAGRQSDETTSNRNGAVYEVNYPFAPNHSSGIRAARLEMDAKTYQPERVSIVTTNADEFRFTRVASTTAPRTEEWARIFDAPAPVSLRPRGSQNVSLLTRVSPLTYAASIASEQEVAVTAALHKLDACLGEEVYVYPMSDGTVLVQGLIDRTERRDAIRGALRSLPFPVSIQLYTPKDLGGAALFPPPDKIAAVNLTDAAFKKIPVADSLNADSSNQEIPLYEQISRHVGKPGLSEDELHQRVAAFSNEAVTLSRQTLLHAWALRRLDSEFSDRRIASLPGSVRLQAAHLREEHLRAISSLTRRQAELLSSLTGSPLAAASSAEATQTDGTILLRLAQQQNLLMRRLFTMSEPVEDTQASLNQLFATLRQISR